ncbi:SDR family NAD(P)-dependent oxidoreductase [Jatrophihabitans sp. DSM 45814]
MNSLDGKVAIITGAGGGIGRECALYMAALGARVVVNDLASTDAGSKAEQVAQEIRDAGGDAFANTDSVSEVNGAHRLVDSAIERFGGLDVLVNNAGILRDRMLANMTVDEWDAISAVHLRGTFLTTQRSAAYWRQQRKANAPVSGSVINMSSGSGLHASVGQSNYAAAKSGIATFTLVAAKEMQRYGCRANSVAPTARTQLTSSTDRLVEIMKPPDDPTAFDKWHPENLAPVVAYLAGPSCSLTGQVLGVFGDEVGIYQPWTVHQTLHNHGNRWDFASLEAAFAGSAPLPPSVGMM